MMEVGKIIIAHELLEQNLSDKFLEALKDIKTPAEISALETEIIGFSNEEITAKIFEQWNLEEELVETIRYSSNPEEADEHIQPYATALLVIKDSINIFGQLEDNAITSSLEILAKNNFNQELFLNAIEKVKQ